jgi:coproporphyrinogen III oxidase-like Fe-S oxidoreductase
MYEGELADRYVKALIREITEWTEVDSPQEVDTVYFGGGTPSLLAPLQIERIMRAVRDRFQISDGAEVTLELNPGDGGTSASARQETTDARCRRYTRDTSAVTRGRL